MDDDYLIVEPLLIVDAEKDWLSARSLGEPEDHGDRRLYDFGDGLMYFDGEEYSGCTA